MNSLKQIHIIHHAFDAAWITPDSEAGDIKKKQPAVSITAVFINTGQSGLAQKIDNVFIKLV